MIRALYHPSPGLNAGDLMIAARQVLAKARAEADAITDTTRQQLAGSVRKLRAQLRRRAGEILQRERSSMLFELHVETERRYREIVARAHRDCLEIALAAAREVVGELVSKDRTVLAAKIRSSLDLLMTGRSLSIATSPSITAAVEAALKKAGIELPVVADEAIEEGMIRIVTSSGAVAISWIDECAEVERRLRDILEARLQEHER